MKSLACIVLALAAGTASAQQLYRCPQGGSIVFSETPCGKAAKSVQLDGQAPSAEDAAAARERTESGKQALQAGAAARAVADATRERERKAIASQQAATLNRAAQACVDRYRTHLAYPNGVAVLGHNINVDGFGRTLQVNVRTITNPVTPARIDPITLNERFLCRLTPQDAIDDRYTADYVERHKRGERL